MKHKELRKRVLDSLNIYASAAIFGPFGNLQRKREDYEKLRDLYELKHGKLFKRP